MWTPARIPSRCRCGSTPSPEKPSKTSPAPPSPSRASPAGRTTLGRSCPNGSSCWWPAFSYDAIGLAVRSAAADGRVRAILLDFDSPGGEVAGMHACAQAIRAAGTAKPVWSHANSCAASAAYLLAAAAARVLIARSGLVGSIGAVAVHVDRSQQDQQLGLAWTAVASGARKVDGWDHKPLSADAEAALQALVDRARDQFAAAVAEYRNLDPAAL